MNYPPCKLACPIQTEAREYIQLIAERRYEQALSAIKRQNPLPRVCGRICTHPCETSCKRGQIEEPISIAGLKRFAADGPWRKPKRPALKKGTAGPKVAIVGSGPAGLSAAHFLAQLGHPVTIFERLPVLGGMMAVGIPSYRLPRDVVADEIRAVANLGVAMKTGVSFGEDITVESLKRDGYRAIFLAIGLHVSRRLNVEGEDLPGVLKGVDFLRDVALGNPTPVGKRVVVVGGGNVAVDVARTALRVGAQEVSMVCLENENEMPAWESELTAAREEGVALLNCFGPRKLLEQNGVLSGVEFKYCSCVFDERGAFCPTYDDTHIQGMTADTVIVAIGQAPDLSFAKKDGLKVGARGGLSVDPATLQTSVEGVFAGGDVVSGPATVTDAIAMGKLAARSIYLYLQGESIATGHVVGPDEVARLPESILEKTRKSERSKVRLLPVNERLQGFAEVEPVLSEEQAVDDALRCLHCYLGARVDKEKCISCLTCVRVCPLRIPTVNKMGEITLDPFLCQACGMCVVECPVQAIDISLNGRKDITRKMETGLNRPDRSGPSGPEMPAIVGFFDLHGNFGARHVEALKNDYPHVVPVMVFGVRRVDVVDILNAFHLGADAVLVACCPTNRDPFPEARDRVKARLAWTRAVLDAVGIGGGRLLLCDMPEQGLVERGTIDALVEQIKKALPDQGRGKSE
jgi:formate dehydrogenase beta subunit